MTAFALVSSASEKMQALLPDLFVQAFKQKHMVL